MNITNDNPLSDKVKINLNELGLLMLYRVGHVDNTAIVTINQRSMVKWCVKLDE